EGEQAAPARARRRAVLRGEAGRADQPVLVERVSSSEAARARRLYGLCHVNVLRLLEAGVDAQGGYLICAAPAGVELQTVARTARAEGGLQRWWLASVLAAAGRGLSALHRHVRGSGWPLHGAIGWSTVFVGWHGEVQLLPC